MKSLYIATLSIFLLTAASCATREIEGKGTTKSISRTVTDVDKIHLSAPVIANITVQPGAKTSIQLSGYANLLEYIETSVDGTTLHVRTKPSVGLNTDKDVVATIVVSSLKKLELDGAANAKVAGIIAGNNFNLDISGAGDASVEQVTVSSLDVSVSGAGKASIARGTASKVSYDVSGAGDIGAYGLQGKDVSVEVSGAGNVEVFAIATLDAQVSGAGSIKYKGTPSVKSSTSGVGEISSSN